MSDLKTRILHVEDDVSLEWQSRVVAHRGGAGGPARVGAGRGVHAVAVAREHALRPQPPDRGAADARRPDQRAGNELFARVERDRVAVV